MIETNLSPWIKTRYELLWNEFKEDSFTTDDVEKVFKESNIEEAQSADIKNIALGRKTLQPPASYIRRRKCCVQHREG